MTDAFSEAQRRLRQRQRVFIVLIHSGCGDDIETRVGAVFATQVAASVEAARLEASHWAIETSIVDRQVDTTGAP